MNGIDLRSLIFTIRITIGNNNNDCGFDELIGIFY